MEYGFRSFVFFVQFVLIVINVHPHFTSASVGVNYGMLGNNLPAPIEVAKLCLTHNIRLLRLFEPHPSVLEILRGTGINVAVGVRNSDIHDIGNSLDVAEEWVKNHIAPYVFDVQIKWIVVGNDMVESFIPNAMTNILTGITSQGLTDYNIKITTAISTKTLGTVFPPSAGDFNFDTRGLIEHIALWLYNTHNPIFVNVETYFAYSSQLYNISLPFAVGTGTEPGIIDGDFEYYTLLEVMVDSFQAAVEKFGLGRPPLVISASGWPSAGNVPATSIGNAKAYNQKVIDVMNNGGTPRRRSGFDVFIFSLFNENKKPTVVEQNYGIFYPNKNPVYELNF